MLWLLVSRGWSHTKTITSVVAGHWERTPSIPAFNELPIPFCQWAFGMMATSKWAMCWWCCSYWLPSTTATCWVHAYAMVTVLCNSECPWNFTSCLGCPSRLDEPAAKIKIVKLRTRRNFKMPSFPMFHQPNTPAWKPDHPRHRAGELGQSCISKIRQIGWQTCFEFRQ